ncbi:hypothetical protein CBL_20091 [Carabus blaptoides fortunei]
MMWYLSRKPGKRKRTGRNGKRNCQITLYGGVNRVHKKGRTKGGILTGIKHHVKVRQSEKTYKNNVQETLIIINKEKWKLLTVYNHNKIREILTEVENNQEGTEEGSLIVGGDFNTRVGEEGGLIDGRVLLQACEEKGWNILNENITDDESGDYTYVGKRGEKTVIDYIITNQERHAKIEKMVVENRIESDHQPIKLILKAQRVRKNEEIIMKYKAIWGETEIENYKKKTTALKFTDGDVEQELWELTMKLEQATEKI